MVMIAHFLLHTPSYALRDNVSGCHCCCSCFIQPRRPADNRYGMYSVVYSMLCDLEEYIHLSSSLIFSSPPLSPSSSPSSSPSLHPAAMNSELLLYLWRMLGLSTHSHCFYPSQQQSQRQRLFSFDTADSCRIRQKSKITMAEHEDFCLQIARALVDQPDGIVLSMKIMEYAQATSCVHHRKKGLVLFMHAKAYHLAKTLRKDWPVKLAQDAIDLWPLAARKGKKRVRVDKEELHTPSEKRARLDTEAPCGARLIAHGRNAGESGGSGTSSGSSGSGSSSGSSSSRLPTPVHAMGYHTHVDASPPSQSKGSRQTAITSFFSSDKLPQVHHDGDSAQALAVKLPSHTSASSGEDAQMPSTTVSDAEGANPPAMFTDNNGTFYLDDGSPFHFGVNGDLIFGKCPSSSAQAHDFLGTEFQDAQASDLSSNQAGVYPATQLQGVQDQVTSTQSAQLQDIQHQVTSTQSAQFQDFDPAQEYAFYAGQEPNTQDFNSFAPTDQQVLNSPVVGSSGPPAQQLPTEQSNNPSAAEHQDVAAPDQTQSMESIATDMDPFEQFTINEDFPTHAQVSDWSFTDAEFPSSFLTEGQTGLFPA